MSNISFLLVDCHYNFLIKSLLIIIKTHVWRFYGNILFKSLFMKVENLRDSLR